MAIGPSLDVVIVGKIPTGFIDVLDHHPDIFANSLRELNSIRRCQMTKLDLKNGSKEKKLAERQRIVP